MSTKPQLKMLKALVRTLRHHEEWTVISETTTNYGSIQHAKSGVKISTINGSYKIVKPTWIQMGWISKRLLNRAVNDMLARKITAAIRKSQAPQS